MPLILVAGDCTGSAYIFTPRSSSDTNTHTVNAATPSTNSKSEGSTATGSADRTRNEPMYDLAFEIECGATVSNTHQLFFYKLSFSLLIYVWLCIRMHTYLFYRWVLQLRPQRSMGPTL